MGDQDMELQAALQASLTGGEYGFAWDNEAGPTHAPVPAPALRQAPLPPQGPEVEFEELDPVAASMARNRAMLERVRREQEFALRETMEAEVAAGFPAGRPEHGEEDEELRRALAASMEGVEEEQGDEGHPILVDDDDDDDDDSEKENVDFRAPVTPPAASAPGAPNTAVARDRVYDDEDQAFQAALRASLESMPPGFVPPPTPPRPSVPLMFGSTTSESQPASTTPSSSANKGDDEYEPEEASSPAPVPSEPLSMDEIRRRRLAKFGG